MRWLAVALSMLAVTANAQITTRDGRTSFRMLFKTGDTVRFTMTLRTALGSGTRPEAPSAAVVTIPLAQRVVRVEGELASLEVSTGPMKMGDRTMGQIATTRVQVDGRGRAIAGDTGSLLTMSALPDRPVRVGDTWRAPADMAGVAGLPSRVMVNYRFLGIKTVEKKTIAEISLSFSGPQNSISGNGTVRLLTRDGSTYSLDMRLRSQIVPDGGQPISTLSTIALRRR